MDKNVDNSLKKIWWIKKPVVILHPKLNNMKYCPRCKETKDFIEFYKNKRQSDGHGIYCKKCQSINAEEYYNRKMNPVTEATKSDLKFNGYNNDSKTFSILVKVTKSRYKSINFSLTDTKRLIDLLTEQVKFAEQNNTFSFNLK